MAILGGYEDGGLKTPNGDLEVDMSLSENRAPSKSNHFLIIMPIKRAIFGRRISHFPARVYPLFSGFLEHPILFMLKLEKPMV